MADLFAVWNVGARIALKDAVLTTASSMKVRKSEMLKEGWTYTIVWKDGKRECSFTGWCNGSYEQDGKKYYILQNESGQNDFSEGFLRKNKVIAR